MKIDREFVFIAVSTIVILAMFGLWGVSIMSSPNVKVDIHKSDLDTLYVPVTIGNVTDFYLIDTGAGYMTITQETLDTIRQTNVVTENGQIEGHLGDSTTIIVPLYIIDSITIGFCTIENVEVAVLPGSKRGLFGLSAMRKIGDVKLSFTNNTLSFDDCRQ